MARLTPQEFTAKHARNLKASVSDIQSGVQKVTQAPGVAAAAKKNKMLANLTARVQDGTWERRVAAVSVQDWQAAMLNKGVGRIATGIDAAADKVTAFASQLLPAVDAAKAKVANMPDLTIEDSINRMSTYIREMSKFRKK
jgi:hypothetical protein